MHILLPLVAPGLVATSVFAFIQAWNEYIMAYVLLNDADKQTITVWLASFTTVRGTDWGPLMAAATLTAVPVIDLLHARAAPGRAGPHGRRGARVSAELERLARGALLPSFRGTDAPDWILRELDEGAAGVVLFATNVADRGQLLGLTRRLRAARRRRA